MAEDHDGSVFHPARLLDLLGQAVVATDADGIVRYWNAAAHRLFGWTADEAVGAQLHKLTGGGALRSFSAEVMAVLRSGGHWSGGLPVRSKNESVFPVLVTNSAIHDDQGRLAGLVTVSIDMGHLVRPLLARLGGASLLVDAGAIVRFCSPATTDMLGWHESELVGTSILDILHPDDVEHVRPWFQVGGPGEEALRLEPEFRMRTREGRWCWVHVRVADLYDDPAVNGLIVTLRDVSETRETLDQLRDLTDQLQMALGSHAIIEQAKGVIADRLGVGTEQAFEWLRERASQDQRRVDDVAAEVVAGLGPAGGTP